MANLIVKPNLAISLWFLISSLVVCWDMSYVMMRPRSMPGGDLHWIWSPYALYGTIDYIYGWPSVKSNNGFPMAQTSLNVVETALNFFYLYLVHLDTSPKAMALGPLIGFTAVVMTFSKTVLYWLNDHFCGWCYTGHNKAYEFWVLFVIPNGAWLLFPALIMVYFGRGILKNLQAGAGIKVEANKEVPARVQPMRQARKSGANGVKIE